MVDAFAAEHLFADGANRIVLVADDDPRFRRAVSDILRRLEFGVIECGTAHEAHLLLVRHHVDAVICDVHMPGSGLDLLAMLDPAQRAHFVVLTADTDPAVAAQARALGAAEILHKPVTLRALSDAIERVLTSPV